MNNDEVIWQVISHKFCSFKVKTVSTSFCRNEYNVSGLCNRTSCPLANSRYATVREIEGSIYLFVKTAERAHSPAKLWEKIKLKKNFVQAVEQINEELIYWPNNMINKCKQRLTKITQYLIKMRKLKLKNTPKLVPINKKIERRELTRERKAEAAAKLEKSIEKELLNRLKNKAYGEEPLNVNEDVWKSILEGEKLEVEEDISEDEEEEEEEEFEEEREFVEAESDDEDLEDLFTNGSMSRGHSDFSDEDLSALDESEGSSDLEPTQEKRKAAEPDPKSKPKAKKPRRKGAYVEIEYEEETLPSNRS